MRRCGRISYLPRKNGKYGYIGSSLVPCFDAKNIAPDMTDCPPKAHNPFVNGNYPSCVCFHQQRLVFAGSKKRPADPLVLTHGQF